MGLLLTPPCPNDTSAAVGEIIRWILVEGRHCRDIAAFVTAFAECLLDHQVSVSRIYLGVRRLHPAIRGRAFTWRADRRSTKVKLRPHGIEATSYYLDNPIADIFSSGTKIRRSLDQMLRNTDYPVLLKLKREGGTDYLALPLDFQANNYQAIAYTSNAPHGFTQSEVEVLEGIVPALAAVIELFNERDDAQRLLATYVGERAGGKILSGSIQRGECDTVNSVLWLCDLENFTQMAETLGSRDLIELLDDYFDAVVTPIEGAGGEVLKFMGDAVLAIFDLTSTHDHAAVCRDAASAAHAAAVAVNELDTKWRGKLGRAVGFGIALHIGKVAYGNVGSASRLDFTAIGPAVNLVSRMEPLTRTLRQKIVMSEDFARQLERPAAMLGLFRLKGLSEPQVIYGLCGP